MKTNRRPLVSVIMSEYNTEERLLENSIRSILNQTYKNIELIIINDGSKNDLCSIVSKFHDNRIKIIDNVTNKGLVYSLNRAIKLSKGYYIARMDTDDESYPDRIEVQVDYLEANKDIDIVGGNAILWDGEEEWGETNYSGTITRELLLKGNPIIHPTVLAKKDAIIKAGLYPDYDRCEDYGLWINAFSQSIKMENIRNILIRYHLSKQDYKKRTLSKRKGFLRLLSNSYNKLSPTHNDIRLLKYKTIVASLLPYNIMFFYHKRFFKRNNNHE